MGDGSLGINGPAGLALAFSDDGRRLLSAGTRGSRVWDVDTWKPVGEDFPAHENGRYPPSLGPGGRTLLTATRKPGDPSGATAGWHAELWDVDAHAVRQRFRPPGTMRAAVCSPDGSRIATAGGGRLVLWDAKTGKELFATAYQRSLRSLEFVARGALVLATVTEGPWEDGKGGSLPQRDDLRSRGHYAFVWDVATGRLVASEGMDLWSYDEDDPAIAGCRPAAVSPDGAKLVAREFEGWGVRDLATGRKVASQCTHCQEDSSHKPPFPIGGAASWIAFSDDGKQFVTVGPRADVVLWESLDLDRARVVDRQRGWKAARFSADRRRILLTAGGKWPVVVDANTGRSVSSRRPAGLGGDTLVAAMSPDGKRLAVSVGEDAVHIYKLAAAD